MLPPENHKHLRVFKAFDAVVSSTFSYELHPDYEQHIRHFEQACDSPEKVFFSGLFIEYCFVLVQNHFDLFIFTHSVAIQLNKD